MFYLLASSIVRFLFSLFLFGYSVYFPGEINTICCRTFNLFVGLFIVMLSHDTWSGLPICP